MKTFNRNTKQKGFTIIELLVSVAVIAIAGLGILVLANRVQASNRADEARKQVLAVQSGIKEQYPNANRTGLSIGVLVTAKKVPENMVDAAGTGAINAWGGAVTAAPATISGGATNNGYSIAWALVPARECNTIVTGLLNNFPEIDVAGTAIKSATVTPDSGDIADACEDEPVALTFRGT